MTTKTKFLLIAGLSAAFVACKKTATLSAQSNAKVTAAKQGNLTGMRTNPGIMKLRK